jgi:LysR family glycine cleavage system transcriptional activator
MRKLPPLTELRAFEAAARHLSFKRAAAELYVTPTAISHQIKLLERLLRKGPVPPQAAPAQADDGGRTAFSGGPRWLPDVRRRAGDNAAGDDGVDGCASRLPTRLRRDGLCLGCLSGAPCIRASSSISSGQMRFSILRRARPTLRSAMRAGRRRAIIASNWRATPSASLRAQSWSVKGWSVIGDKSLSPAELAKYPLIETEWPSTDLDAPNWKRWQTMARRRLKRVPDLARLQGLAFREELHAIEAAISGQGIAICSDVLVAPELASGVLMQVSKLTLPGYGFYLLYRPGHPKLTSISAFCAWARSMQQEAR